MKIICRRFGVKIGPEEFHHLFTVKLVMGLQGQEFDEQDRLTPRPTALLYRVAVHGNAKGAEQMNL